MVNEKVGTGDWRSGDELGELRPGARVERLRRELAADKVNAARVPLALVVVAARVHAHEACEHVRQGFEQQLRCTGGRGASSS